MRPYNLSTPDKNSNDDKENLDPYTERYSPRTFKKIAMRRDILKDITIKKEINNDNLDKLFQKLTDSPVKERNLRDL